MKFIVSSTTLLKQLQAIGGVVNSSNTLPILDYFLFDIKENDLTIFASDLDTTISANIGIEAQEAGLVAIPAKLLIDTLKTFPEQPLTFTVAENFGIEILSDLGKYKLSGLNGEEFPKVPTIEGANNVDLPSSTLLKAISKTIFATSNDDLRPVMCGVFVELDESNITFVATDAHKLVRFKSNGMSGNTPGTFIIPKKPLNVLKSLLNSTEADVALEYNDTNVHFKFDNVNLICRLVDGKYPNYEAVIPKVNPNKLTIERSSFLNSIKRVAIFSNKTTHQVRLKLTGSELVISAEDIDFSNEANEKLTCNYEGADLEIGFNSKFMIEMLSNIETDNVSLELSEPNRAGLIFPFEEQKEDVLMLVMPVMLNN